jgi:hypothetical protein
MISRHASLNEFPKYPLPYAAPPQEPQRPHVQPPTVFVYERQAWEYKVITKNALDDVQLTEDELNALGKDGWELVGVVPDLSAVRFYLKRAGGLRRTK